MVVVVTRGSFRLVSGVIRTDATAVQMCSYTRSNYTVSPRTGRSASRTPAARQVVPDRPLAHAQPGRRLPPRHPRPRRSAGPASPGQPDPAASASTAPTPARPAPPPRRSPPAWPRRGSGRPPPDRPRTGRRPQRAAAWPPPDGAGQPRGQAVVRDVLLGGLGHGTSIRPSDPRTPDSRPERGAPVPVSDPGPRLRPWTPEPWPRPSDL